MDEALIAMRKRYKAFGRGTLEFLYPENHRVLAFIRRYQDEVILVIANLSRFVQYAGLDLSAFKGTTPVEFFGRAEFPQVGESPYFLSLGAHSFYWFLLMPAGNQSNGVEVCGRRFRSQSRSTGPMPLPDEPARV